MLAGLEAVSAVGRSERTLGVVVFRDEETGCHGSRWRVRHGSLPGSYVELHIEQGPRLDRAGAPLGVVTGIVAYARRKVSFTGAAGHAGTKPMDARDDALCKAAEYVLRVRDAAAAIDGAVGTVGVLEVEPGAVNVIPGSVNLTVDARAPDDERLGRLLSELGLEPEPIVPAALMAEPVRRVLREEVERLGLPVVELPSGAGHDAGVLAAAGVEAGMLFVRSLNGGVSHSPDEHSSDEDIALAVEVLTATLAPRQVTDCYSSAAVAAWASNRLLLSRSRKLIACAPSQRVSRPSSFRCSAPSTSVAKWFAHSSPALLLKWQ